MLQTYGELLHEGISDILIDHAGLRGEHHLTDLGSGLGQVVLHVALEV